MFISTTTDKAALRYEEETTARSVLGLGIDDKGWSEH